MRSRSNSSEEETEEETEEEREKRMAMEKKARDKKAKDAKAAKDRKARDEKDDTDTGTGEEDDEDRVGRDKKARDRKAKDEKKAMDAAIETATAGVIARMNAAMEAREIVRPLVGTVSLALDSAEAVYKHALDAHRIPLNGVHPSAYKAMVGMLPRPGQQRPAPLAMDAAASEDAFKMFPGLARIRLS